MAVYNIYTNCFYYITLKIIPTKVPKKIWVNVNKSIYLLNKTNFKLDFKWSYIPLPNFSNWIIIETFKTILQKCMLSVYYK